MDDPEERAGKDFFRISRISPARPFSAAHPRDEVRLGRETDWILAKEDPLEIPYGQKLFVLDEERSIAILEIRSLQFDDSIPQS